MPTLPALPLWAQIAVAVIGGLLVLPWAIRGYVAYWDAALGRPGHLVETLMPLVR